MLYLKQENDEKLSEYLDSMKFIDTEKNPEDQEMSEPQPKQCKLTARAKKIHKEKVIKCYIVLFEQRTRSLQKHSLLA